MKKATILLLILATGYGSMAQSTMRDTLSPVLTKEDYLQKSKSNKTAALVCLVGGGTLFLIGSIVAVSDLNNGLDNLFTPNTSENHDALIGVLVITGGAAMLGSIPLFRAAHKYKRRAYSLSFINEQAPQLQNGMVFYRFVPSLSLKIRL